MKKYMKYVILSFSFFLLLFSSCVPLKDYVYLQGDVTNQDVKTVEPEAYRIQPNDNLYIQVISNDELSLYFNLSPMENALSTDAAIEIHSYKVDSNGEIDFPYIGTIKVAGLTTQEIKELISKGISELLVQYSVVVKQVNCTVSLLGEFNEPGTYVFYKDRMTIFEAIGLGNDLTDFGNRHNVKIIRHLGGVKEIETVDLTSTDIFKSEYYYILPNDIIYVEPTNKVYGAKTIAISTIVSAVSVLFNIYYILDRTLWSATTN